MSYKELAGDLSAGHAKFAVVISRFNDLLTRQLLQGALDCLIRHGAEESSITVAWVPGSYEIPLAAQKLAASKSYAAVIALGAVVQGATPHAGLINSQVARALAQIGLQTQVPVIDGVVAADNLEQAIERCGTKSGNRGWNAALAALEMVNLMKLI